MRDSFFHLKEWYMTTEHPEDFELVRDYVVERTKTSLSGKASKVILLRYKRDIY